MTTHLDWTQEGDVQIHRASVDGKDRAGRSDCSSRQVRCASVGGGSSEPFIRCTINPHVSCPSENLMLQESYLPSAQMLTSQNGRITYSVCLVYGN